MTERLRTPAEDPASTLIDMHTDPTVELPAIVTDTFASDAGTLNVEGLRDRVDQGMIAIHGLGAVIAEKRGDRANRRIEKLEHREELYQHLGEQALAKLVPKRPEPAGNRGIRGRGMNRERLFSPPGPYMEIVPPSREQKPKPKTITERVHAARLNRKVESFEDTKKVAQRLRNTSKGSYKSVRTNIKRLFKGKSAEPVIKKTAWLKETELKQSIRASAVRRAVRRPLGSRIDKIRLERTRKAAVKHDRRAAHHRVKQTELRHKLAATESED